MWLTLKPNELGNSVINILIKVLLPTPLGPQTTSEFQTRFLRTRGGQLAVSYTEEDIQWNDRYE